MILFIDDEPVRMLPWSRALGRAFRDVRVCSTGQEALELLRGDRLSLELFIWDLMMPTPPGLADAQTEYGTRTGLPLYREFRKRYPETPAILLTNVRDDALLSKYRKGHDRAFRKKDLEPAELVGLARRLMSKD